MNIQEQYLNQANSYFMEWGGEEDSPDIVSSLVDSWASFYSHAGYMEEINSLNLDDLVDEVREAGLDDEDGIDAYLSAKYLGIDKDEASEEAGESEEFPTEDKKICDGKEEIDEFSKINIPKKTVSEIGDDFDFVTDSQDVEAVKDFVGEDPQISLDKYDAFFVLLNDAGDDYDEVWGMEGTVPDNGKTVERVYPKFYVEKKEEKKEEVTEESDPIEDKDEVKEESHTPKKPTLEEGLRFRAYEILAEENEYLSI